MNKSVATIDAPEFINLQTSDISPFIKQGEVKVLYTGKNRNGSYISKDTAERMGKTLRGAPIVGFYKDDVGDFRDHGEKVTWDCDDFKFECMTKPYGFVPLDAKVWFQKFIDTNEFGEQVEREYLMTTCYLWAGQYEEANLPFQDGGRPHSMELDDDTLDGHWTTDEKGIEFFIINDANITKLCILGLDVEPCFEGSSVTAPNVSTSFTKDSKSFIEELREMVRQVEFAKKGGLSMTTETIDKSIVEQPNTEFNLNFEDGSGDAGASGGDGNGAESGSDNGAGGDGNGTGAESSGTGSENGNSQGAGNSGEGTGSNTGADSGNQSNSDDPVADITAIAGQASAGTIEGDVAQVEGQAIVDTTVAATATAEANVATAEAALAEAEASGDAEAIAEAEAALETAETALETAQTTQASVEAQQETINAVASDQQSSDAAGSGNVVPKESFTALEEKYNALLAEVESLREYKLKVENVERDAIIAKFSMLPEDILKEVSDNKEKYSLNDLENHLKVLYFDNNVTLEKKQEEKKVEPVTTFNLEGCEAQQLPAWLAEVKATQEKLNGRN